MSKKATDKWFLFCKDKESNEDVALALSALKGFNPDFSHLLCADGEYRHLYEVPDCSFARRFIKERYQVEIFFSQKDGKPQRFNLPIRIKPTLSEIVHNSEKMKIKIAKSALRHRQR